MTESVDAWIGRQEVRTDVLEASRSSALLTALGQPDELKPGDPLPLLHHWLYFWDVRPPSELGPDGHPKRGGFLPPIALPRRMWAGGRLSFHQFLLVGERVTRQSTITQIETKSGRSGTLVFVTVKHELSGANGLAISEEQDLVFREPSAPAIATVAPAEATAGDWADTVDANSTLLFRYSALTLNGHRIHYDLPYATGEEGYGGLVVHGPLQAQLLLDFATRHLPGHVTGFSFRGLSPALHTAGLDLSGTRHETGASVWTHQSGHRCMTAEVTCS